MTDEDVKAEAEAKQPLVVHVLFDVSGSMVTQFAMCSDGLMQMAETHACEHEHVSYAVTTFAEETTSIYNGSTTQCNDPNAAREVLLPLRKALREVECEGRTRLYDTLYSRITQMMEDDGDDWVIDDEAENQQVRRIMVVVTDGNDNCSTLINHVLVKARIAQAKTHGIDVVYIGIGDVATWGASANAIHDNAGLRLAVSRGNEAAAFSCLARNISDSKGGCGVLPFTTLQRTVSGGSMSQQTTSLLPPPPTMVTPPRPTLEPMLQPPLLRRAATQEPRHIRSR